MDILEQAGQTADWAWQYGEYAELRDKSQQASASLLRLVCAIQSGAPETIHQCREDAMMAAVNFLMTAENM